MLEEGANGVLRYQRSAALVVYLAQRIEEALTDVKVPTMALRAVHALITQFDYRLVGDYLRVLRSDDAPAINNFTQLITTNSPAERNRLLYEIARTRFTQTVSLGDGRSVVLVPQLEDVFSRTGHGLFVYRNDHSMQSQLNSMIRDIDGRLGDFIEQQYDLPGLNNVVRFGVVKSWFLPGGTTVVSKRENVDKPGRFQIEQFNYEAVLSRMGRRSEGRVCLARTAEGDSVWLMVVRPFAIISDGYSGRRYALSVWDSGASLEDLLMDQHESVMRPVYLTHYRQLLDALYDRGILWGDISPRNVVVRREGRDLVYHILDFEKTLVLDGPATTAQRITHCQEQNCVEELANVCTQSEVEECFKGYYAFEGRDPESDAALSFVPRPKLGDILRGRGLHQTTLGTYNQVDLEVTSVRVPDTDPATGQRRFPAHLNHKIENYLRGMKYKDFVDHDRKTTEVLIAAKHQGCYYEVINVLSKATDRVEIALLKAEFDGLLEDPPTYCVMPPRHVTDELVHTIDRLYQSREHANDFACLCDHLTLTEALDSNRNGSVQ